MAPHGVPRIHHTSSTTKDTKITQIDEPGEGVRFVAFVLFVVIHPTSLFTLQLLVVSHSSAQSRPQQVRHERFGAQAWLN